MTQEIIKASPLQRDPQFIKDLASGQRRHRRYFDAAKANTDFSDAKILECFIIDNDIVIGVFKDTEYELGWGFYFIKGRTPCL